jgi:putative ABC transport system permease protein
VTIAWRNLMKNKVHTLINVLGLAVGMAACITILVFVRYEASFDQMHSKNLYKLNTVEKFDGPMASKKNDATMFPMAPTIKQEFPEVINATRIYFEDDLRLDFGDKAIYFPRMYYVDSTFLQMFDFPLISGNRETVLQRPNSIVLTRSSARKLFGNTNPIGKTVYHISLDTTVFQVTGVMENVPLNSQLQFDGLMSFSTITKPSMMNGWGATWVYTFLELAPNTNATAFEKKFPAYLKRHLPRNQGGETYELYLVPLKEVHAGSADISYDSLNFQKFDKNYTRIFSTIALIVLLIACVNFMNLSTARSAERSREVGIRKTIGAYRYQLAIQFLSESIVLSLFSALFAICMVKLALPYVSSLCHRELSLPISREPSILIALLSGAMFVGIISGLYPAWFLSSFRPVAVIKGTMQSGNNKSFLRNTLVVFQFASAIFLTISTIYIVRQLHYMQSRDPGFNREQVLTVPLDVLNQGKYSGLKEELLKNTLIKSVTGAWSELGSPFGQWNIQFQGDGPKREFISTGVRVDPDYLKLFNMKILMGRNFSSEESANGKEYIINEALARELLADTPDANFSSLLGKPFGINSLGHIVGIAKDFNFNSLHYKIETMFMVNNPNRTFSLVYIKINGVKAKEAIAYIQSVWKNVIPFYPFEYQFLDDHFKELYLADSQISSIVGILAGLAVAISCLGLFGLASYAAERRIREIGIRKVLGASVQSIVVLMTRHFLALVILANVIACPLAWFGLNRWFRDYAYRTSMDWWIFLLAGAIALLIALMTTSAQAIRAAVSNPVESLRTE